MKKTRYKYDVIVVGLGFLKLKNYQISGIIDMVFGGNQEDIF